MWGTSSSEEKLAGDPGNVIEATSIGGRWSDFFTAGKLAPGNFGLLQQYLPLPDSCTAARGAAVARLFDHLVGAGKSVGGTSRPSAFATIRLTRSNLVGCSTGRSAGFAPRKILSIKLPRREGHRPTGVENSYFS